MMTISLQTTTKFSLAALRGKKKNSLTTPPPAAKPLAAHEIAKRFSHDAPAAKPSSDPLKPSEKEDSIQLASLRDALYAKR